MKGIMAIELSPKEGYNNVLYENIKVDFDVDALEKIETEQVRVSGESEKEYALRPNPFWRRLLVMEKPEREEEQFITVQKRHVGQINISLSENFGHFFQQDIDFFLGWFNNVQAGDVAVYKRNCILYDLGATRYKIFGAWPNRVDPRTGEMVLMYDNWKKE